MRTLRLLLVLATAVMLASSALAKPTLVGTWSGTLTVQGVKVDMVMTFGRNGILALKQTVKGQGSTQKGKYTEGKNSFTMTPTSIESTSVPKASLDSMNATMAKNPTTVTFTLEWKGGDTILISQKGAQPPLNAKITMKRKK